MNKKELASVFTSEMIFRICIKLPIIAKTSILYILFVLL